MTMQLDIRGTVFLMFFTYSWHTRTNTWHTTLTCAWWWSSSPDRSRDRCFAEVYFKCKLSEQTTNKQQTNKQTNNYIQTNSQQVWCMEAAACTIKVQCTTRIWIVYVIMIAHATWLSYNLVHTLTCSWYCHTCNSWYCTDHVCSQWADIMRHTSHRKLALLQIFYVRNINEHSVNLLTNKG